MSENFSFSAKLDDKVSPNLGKMEGKLRSVQSALSSFVNSFKASGENVASSSKKSATKTMGSLNSLDESLKRSSAHFNTLGETAVASSKKISDAVQSSLYGKGASERLESLDDDLGKLNNTFSGMASKQRAVTGRARTLASTTKDSINRKVIPAFQTLHASLDDYPDTLKEINRLESERYDILEKQPKLLDKVTESMSGFGDKLKEVKFGLSDAMAVLTTGYLGNVGLQVQEHQRDFARAGGTGGVTDLVETLRKTTALSRAPMEDVAPVANIMEELKLFSQDAMPDAIAGLVDLGKALGVSASELAFFQDKLHRVQGMRKNEFGQMMDDITAIAQSSSATSSELSGVIEGLGLELRGMNEAARRKYAKSAIAAASAAKDAGLDMSTPQAIRSKKTSSPEELVKFYALAQAGGYSKSVDEMLGSDSEIMIATNAGSKYGKKSFGMSNKDLSKQTLKGVVQSSAFETIGGFADIAIKGIGDPSKYDNQETTGAAADTSAFVRGTLTEMLEQLQGTTQSAAITSGEKIIRATGTVMGKLEEMAIKGASVFDKLDKKLGGGLSTFGAGAVLGKAAFGVGDALTGGKLSAFTGGGGIKGLITKVALLSIGAYVGRRLITSGDAAKEANGETQEQKSLAARIMDDPDKFALAGLAGIQKFMKKAQESVSSFFEKHKPAIEKFFGKVVDAGIVAMGWLADKAEVAWDFIKKASLAAWDFIKKASLAAWEVSKDFFGYLQDSWSAIKTVMKEVWTYITDISSDLWKIVKNIFKGLKNMGPDMKEGLKTAWETSKKIITNLAKIFKNVTTFIIDNKDVIGDILGAVFWFLGKIAKSIANITRAFTTAMVAMTDFASGVSSVVRFIRDIPKSIKSLFKAFWESALDADSVKDLFTRFWKDLINHALGRDKEAELTSAEVAEKASRHVKRNGEEITAEIARRRHMTVAELTGASETVTGASETVGGINPEGILEDGREMSLEGLAQLRKSQGATLSESATASTVKPINSHSATADKIRRLQGSQKTKTEELGEKQVVTLAQILGKLTIMAEKTPIYYGETKGSNPTMGPLRQPQPGQDEQNRILSRAAGY